MADPNMVAEVCGIDTMECDEISSEIDVDNPNSSLNNEDEFRSSRLLELEELLQGLKDKFASLEATKAKELRLSCGVLAEVTSRTGQTLPDSTITKINDFYNDDSISRIMPGIKETVSVKVDGERVKLFLVDFLDEALLLELVAKETEKRSLATIQTLLAKEANSTQDLNLETTKSMESDHTEEEGYKDSEKDTVFIWPDKAVMLFLELYRERENDFITGLKRHNKLWSEIASELKNLNYNVSGVQAQNKMSSLKRTYKKIKDSNTKSGNHNSSWTFYSIMDSLFGDKAWVSPPAIASSDGPAVPNTLASSSSASSSSTCHSLPFSSVDDSEVKNSECQELPSKPKRRKVEVILDSFISDLKNNRDQMKEERKRERLEREEKKEKKWEIKRAERKEMHKESFEIQRSLVQLLSKLVEK
ncbi:uncharacterized protein [Temnothorax nylanderi]|uniref:uncharacterized protein n=1 Tax=Temnothorax nylanderi TaxID=102681 RepID=UPI003A89CF7B